jgi:hypothetical protein
VYRNHTAYHPRLPLYQLYPEERQIVHRISGTKKGGGGRSEKKKHTTYDDPCYVLAPYIIHHSCNPCAQDILCLLMFILSTCSYFAAAATGAAAAAAAASADVVVAVVLVVVVLVMAGAGALAAVAA